MIAETKCCTHSAIGTATASQFLARHAAVVESRLWRHVEVLTVRRLPLNSCYGKVTEWRKWWTNLTHAINAFDGVLVTLWTSPCTNCRTCIIWIIINSAQI